MDAGTLRERVEAFPRWHYAFDLGAVRTPIHDERKVNRHEQRRPYLMAPLVELLGGSLNGRRVLDLGCNAGFWSLCAIEAGCDHVVGVDGFATHIEQARLVFDALEVDPERYAFRHEDVFALDPAELGTFDVVLCLGLLYHVAKPMELMEVIDACCEDVLVVDTLLARGDGSAFELRRELEDCAWNDVENSVVMVPTRQAVLDLVARFGFQARVLEPAFSSFRGARDYQIGLRRGFLCSRRTPLPA